MTFPARPRRHRPFGRLAMFVLLLPCLAALAGWVVKSLWNAVLVDAIGARPLSFWQALGLLLLCRILLGHWGPRRRPRWSDGGPGSPAGPASPGGSWRDKWRSMTPQQREMFRSHWRARCAGSGRWPSRAESKEEGTKGDASKGPESR